MAGHNKWSKVKRSKNITDIKKAKVFTKILREIYVAVKTGGVDAKNNPRLRDAIRNAKLENLPKINIDKAIQKSSGANTHNNYESCNYEAYGPGGSALIIECLTDNRNRTIADIRTILNKKGGRLGAFNSVYWMFSKIALSSVETKYFKNIDDIQKCMNDMLTIGILDIEEQNDVIHFEGSLEIFDVMRDMLESYVGSNFDLKLVLIAQQPVTLSQEQALLCNTLVDALEDLDDVQNVTTNY